MTGNSYILVDTSVFIDHIRIKNKRASKLNSVLTLYSNPLAASIISVVELYSGSSVWENDTNKHQLEKLLDDLKILSIDTGIAVEAGRLRCKYKIGVADSIIASTALVWDCSLATLDKDNFAKIPNLRLLDF